MNKNHENYLLVGQISHKNELCVNLNTVYDVWIIWTATHIVANSNQRNLFLIFKKFIETKVFRQDLWQLALENILVFLIQQ